MTGFTSFTGDSERSVKEVKISCLYVRTMDTFTRNKYGLEEDVTGIIYVAPEELKRKLGSTKFDETKVTVDLNGDFLLIKKVVYLQPMYDTYIAAEIRLKKPTNAGD